VPAGVDLVARVPGSATLRAEASAGTAGSGSNAASEWIAIEAVGQDGGRISGIRIESAPDSPVDVGIKIAGQGRSIALVDLSGAMRAGIDVTSASNVDVDGSVMAIQGTAIALADGARATLRGNTFLRAGRLAEPPIALAGSAQVVASRNTFAGFGKQLVKLPNDEDVRQILNGNFVIAPEALIQR
jgi:hypothetical protein